MIKLAFFRENFFNYIYNFFLVKSNKNSVLKNFFGNYFKAILIILLSTFSLAVLFSNLVSYTIIGLVFFKKTGFSAKISYKSDIQNLTYPVLQKNIIARNIFNHDGEIPYEDTPQGSESFLLKNFDKVPCSMTEKLPVELVGIIYTGNPQSNLVSLKDPLATMVDVYKEGQQIIDYESYSLHKVTGPVSAEFRHDTKKICVSLNPQNYNTNNIPSAAESASMVTLSTSFVSEQLGPGFSQILNSARLVPQIIDGKTTGFKIFSIAKDSLFDKIQLMNGDVIKNINGVNLEDSSQGFKIYEVFQVENNITIQIERNGETLTKKVTVQ